MPFRITVKYAFNVQCDTMNFMDFGDFRCEGIQGVYREEPLGREKG